MNYIKICPSCNRHNPEAARVCENAQCKKFLGQVKPVQDLGPERETPPQPFKESETIGQHGPEDYDSMKPGDVGCTKRSSEPFFYLECRTASKIYEVHSGQVVGRKDPTSTAHIQMEGIPDINFVSRQHCRFDHQDGTWYITVLPGAMNPSRINDAVIEKGTRSSIRDGDILKLDVVPFQIRIIA